MTSLNPYLSFNGCCREAMTFYKDCLGGELVFMTVSESPMAEHMPDKQDIILHAALTNGRIVLMGTDCAREAPIQGLSLNFTSEEETRDAFAKLAVGGQVMSPLEPAFWGALFGFLSDKFGMNCMLNCDNNTHKE